MAMLWDVDKDDTVYRKEVTSQLASLAAMFENILTAICGWLIYLQDVGLIADTWTKPSDISKVIIEYKDSSKTVIESPQMFPIVISAIFIIRVNISLIILLYFSANIFS